MDDAPVATEEKAGPPWTLDWAIKNVTAITALSSLMAVSCAMFYVIGYTGVQPGIFEYLDYADMLQIAITQFLPRLFSFVCVSFVLSMEIARRSAAPLARPSLRTGAAILVLLVIILAFFTRDELTTLSASTLLITAIVMAVVIAVGFHISRLHWLFVTGVGMFFVCYLLGYGAAKYDAAHHSSYDVGLKDGGLQNVQLLLKVSHGYIFRDEQTNHVIFIPDGEIKRIERK